MTSATLEESLLEVLGRLELTFWKKEGEIKFCEKMSGNTVGHFLTCSLVIAYVT